MRCLGRQVGSCPRERREGSLYCERCAPVTPTDPPETITNERRPDLGPVIDRAAWEAWK